MQQLNCSLLPCCIANAIGIGNRRIGNGSAINSINGPMNLEQNGMQPIEVKQKVVLSRARRSLKLQLQAEARVQAAAAQHGSRLTD
jgi:hypothetical protein